MSERPIGKIIAPIMDRCLHLQPLHIRIQACRTPALRKSFIMAMRQIGEITDDETALLIEAYQLEAA